jgi:hypothetical protein
MCVWSNSAACGVTHTRGWPHVICFAGLGASDVCMEQQRRLWRDTHAAGWPHVICFAGLGASDVCMEQQHAGGAARRGAQRRRAGPWTR